MHRCRPSQGLRMGAREGRVGKSERTRQMIGCSHEGLINGRAVKIRGRHSDEILLGP